MMQYIKIHHHLHRLTEVPGDLKFSMKNSTEIILGVEVDKPITNFATAFTKLTSIYSIDWLSFTIFYIGHNKVRGKLVYVHRNVSGVEFRHSIRLEGQITKLSPNEIKGDVEFCHWKRNVSKFVCSILTRGNEILNIFFSHSGPP